MAAKEKKAELELAEFGSGCPYPGCTGTAGGLDEKSAFGECAICGRTARRCPECSTWSQNFGSYCRKCGRESDYNIDVASHLSGLSIRQDSKWRPVFSFAPNNPPNELISAPGYVLAKSKTCLHLFNFKGIHIGSTASRTTISQVHPIFTSKIQRLGILTDMGLASVEFKAIDQRSPNAKSFDINAWVPTMRAKNPLTYAFSENGFSAIFYSLKYHGCVLLHWNWDDPELKMLSRQPLKEPGEPGRANFSPMISITPKELLFLSTQRCYKYSFSHETLIHQPLQVAYNLDRQTALFDTDHFIGYKKDSRGEIRYQKVDSPFLSGSCLNVRRNGISQIAVANDLVFVVHQNGIMMSNYRGIGTKEHSFGEFDNIGSPPIPFGEYVLFHMIKKKGAINLNHMIVWNYGKWREVWKDSIEGHVRSPLVSLTGVWAIVEANGRCELWFRPF
jgi:hypothetical protein